MRYLSLSVRSWFFVIFALMAGFMFVSPVHAQSTAGIGDLVKCPDFTSVYYIGDDGYRHPFSNEQSYTSWYGTFDEESGEHAANFEDVITISCDDLSSMSLGDAVTYQAGTSLVKIPSVPIVYAVEPDGVLREIPDEKTAEDLYGENWSQQVDDLSEAFFSHYELGEPLEDDEIPAGLLLAEGDEIFRVNSDGDAEQIDQLLAEDEKDFYGSWAENIDEVEERTELEFELLREEFLSTVEDFLDRTESLFDAVRIDDEDQINEDDFEKFAEMSEELIEMFKSLEVFLDMHGEFDVWEDYNDYCPEVFIETFASCQDAEDRYALVEDALMDAEDALDDAMDLVHEEEWTGKRTDTAWDLIGDGWDLLDEAWDDLDVSWDIWEEDTTGEDTDLLLMTDTALANADAAFEIAERVLSGEGIEAIDEDEWQEWQELDEDEDWCEDSGGCWWEDEDYNDDDYWEDTYDEWYDECVSRGECESKDGEDVDSLDEDEDAGEEVIEEGDDEDEDIIDSEDDFTDDQDENFDDDEDVEDEEEVNVEEEEEVEEMEVEVEDEEDDNE